MSFDPYQKKTCRYCDAKLGNPFLELGAMPLANNLPMAHEKDIKEFECPLSLVYCPKCHFVQLSHVVPPELMFSHYLYVSSTTQTFRDHFASYASTVRQKLGSRPHPLAVDIGSNDGLLLACYQKEEMRAVGVDPAKNLADEANKLGRKTLNHFFNESSVRQILAEDGPADAVSANNVFAHIDDIQSVCRNVKALLKPNGLFVIEFPYLVTMLDKLYFDMIYHEHLSYIAIHPLRYLLKRFDMEIFDIQEVSSHGGSLRVFIQKKGGGFSVAAKVADYLRLEEERGCLGPEIYQVFADQVRGVKASFMEMMKDLKAWGKTIAGYGAPAKASTIVNFYGLTPSQIDYVVDDNPLKQNRLMPGVKIPIVSSQYMKDHPTDYVVIFAWNFAKEILQKIGFLRCQGTKFLVPLVSPEQLFSHTSQKPSFLVEPA